MENNRKKYKILGSKNKSIRNWRVEYETRKSEKPPKK